MSTSAQQPGFDFDLTLRIMGREVPNAQISRSLGSDPDRWHRQRAVPLSKAGGSVRPYREDLWSRSWRGVGARALETTLQTVAQSLVERSDALDAIRAGELRVDLMLGIFSMNDNFGLSLSALNLSSLAALGIDVHIDVHFTADA